MPFPKYTRRERQLKATAMKNASYGTGCSTMIVLAVFTWVLFLGAGYVLTSLFLGGRL